MGNYSEWDRIYRAYPLEELGWELGKPRPILVEYMKKGLLPSGRALDTCCGAGTNTTYLAQNHLEVTGSTSPKQPSLSPNKKPKPSAPALIS
jgi:2-polyprenyl-3-methyl-5-hydroxy-6-metoxy-1,4-benzoquinol methylase